jgi:hypothetical protein
MAPRVLDVVPSEEHDAQGFRRRPEVRQVVDGRLQSYPEKLLMTMALASIPERLRRQASRPRKNAGNTAAPRGTSLTSMKNQLTPKSSPGRRKLIC